MAGYEGGIDIRRDDGTLDASIEIRGRNGEVHLALNVDGSTYAWARIGLDLKPSQAHELIGALKDAIDAAEARRPRDNWTALQVGHVLGERD